MTIPHHPGGSQPSDHQRPVTFDLIADDDTYYVLTEALREFAWRHRQDSEGEPAGTVRLSTRLAECAEKALGLVEQAMSLPGAPASLEQVPPTDRAGLWAELERLVQGHRAWEETARACVCPPGLCTRGEFRDHAGASEGCMVCADLDPDQPCYTAVVRALCAQAGR